MVKVKTSYNVPYKGMIKNFVEVLSDGPVKPGGKKGQLWECKCHFQSKGKPVCGKIFYLPLQSLTGYRPAMSCGCYAKSPEGKAARRRNLTQADYAYGYERI